MRRSRRCEAQRALFDCVVDAPYHVKTQPIKSWL